MGASPQTTTLTATTVATITLDKDYEHLEVLNVTGTDAVYFAFGTTTPTVAGDTCQVLPACINSLTVQPRQLGHTAGTNTAVKLISAGTPTISVRGIE